MPESHGGLYPIAVLLFHPSESVRNLVVTFLRNVDSYKVCFTVFKVANYVVGEILHLKTQRILYANIRQNIKNYDKKVNCTALILLSQWFTSSWSFWSRCENLSSIFRIYSSLSCRSRSARNRCFSSILSRWFC